MSSPCRDRLVAALLAACGVAAGAQTLRVCADPDNLPYSRADGSGFENRIASVVADELHRPLEFVWEPEGRGHVRKTVDAGRCDLLIGVPAGADRLATTLPYYRSGYVFVDRAEAGSSAPVSFDDARLASARVGVQLVGDDLAATPPGYALARHGVVEHVVGYPLFGTPPAAQRAVADLAADRLDIAVLWGPQAGYFAAHSPVALRLAPAVPPSDVPLPFDFAIAMGVRRGDESLRRALDAVIVARGAEMRRILDDYAVPRLPLATKAAP